MPTTSRPPQSRSPRLVAGLALGLVLLLVAACNAGAAPTSPSATDGAARPTGAPPSPTASPSATGPDLSPAPTPATQTDTAWGRIWDGLPAGFPTWPGATPTQTGAGAASAVLDAGSGTPSDIVTFYQSGLEGAGYSTVSKTGPREDGSWELDATGAASCKVQVTAAPLGTSVIITILYGAGCPFG